MKSPPTAATAARDAALWTLRCDRGLSATEQDELSQWLAADPQHRAALGEHRWGWDELDRLAGLQTSVHAIPDPDLLAPPKARVRGVLLRFVAPIALAAAAVTLGLFLWQARAPLVPTAAPVRSLALIEQRELSDGSVIELNRGAIVTEHFTSTERRVRLQRGEAHFKVAKDAARPFFVEAGGVAVRAVGTAFNVRLDSASVEVLVTEGRVKLETATAAVLAPVADEGSRPGPVAPEPTFLGAGERTVVSLAPAAPAPQVAPVPPAEIEARLAWQPRLLDFTSAPLPEIVAEFNRRNPVRLILGDAALAEMRLSATLRSDNLEGFVRLMASDFGLSAEWRGDDQIVLTRAGQ